MAEKAKQPTLNMELLLTRVVDELNLINEKLGSLIELNGKILKTQEELLRMAADKSQLREELDLSLMQCPCCPCQCL